MNSKDWWLVGSTRCWTHSGHHVQVLLRAAEVLGQVVHAEVFMLAGVDPGSVFFRAWDPVQEDPECFPNRLLTNWRDITCLFILMFSFDFSERTVEGKNGTRTNKHEHETCVSWFYRTWVMEAADVIFHLFVTRAHRMENINERMK